MIRPLLLCFGFCLLTTLCPAQNAKYLYKIAEEHFYGENPSQALIEYQEVARVNPTYLDVKYKIELCHLLSGSRDRPLDKILEYRETLAKGDKFYYFFLGKILDYRYQFDDAITAWKQFLRLDAYKSKEIIEETRFFISESERKKDFMSTYGDFRAAPMPVTVNSEKAQFSPIFLPAQNEFIYLTLDNPDEQKLSLYKMSKKENAWDIPQGMDNLKSIVSDVDNFIVTDQGEAVFFFRDKNLWTSKRSGDSWGRPQEWKEGPTKMKPAYHFFMNESKDRIMYPSEANYKKRGLELMELRREGSGKWGKPTNLPSAINSDGDERNAYLTADGNTLYFSSTGHNSIGGYDIFRSTYNAGSWSAPENLGYPINTPDDDIDFYIAADGESGFFSSDRTKGLGDYDLFYFYKAKTLELEGTISDVVSKNVLSDITLQFVANNISQQTIEVNSNELGKYVVSLVSDTEYRVVLSDGGELLTTESLRITNLQQDSSMVKDFVIDRLNLTASNETQAVEDGEVVDPRTVISQISEDDPERYKEYEKSATDLSNLGSKYRRAQKAVLNNIYFDFGTAQLKSESYEVLDELLFTLNYYPSLEIVLTGHTDNVGPAAANQWLSENRASAVKNFLVKLGISEERITVVGMGESEPIASNDNELEGRELNRRIEVLVKE